MAKRKVNKSEAVRNYLTDHPDARPVEIRQALKQKGLDVAPGLIGNVKSRFKQSGKRRGKKKRRANKKSMRRPAKAMGRVRGVAAENEITINDLMEVRDFVNRLGGIETAQRALQAWAEVQASE